MHNAAFRHGRMPWRYLKFRVPLSRLAQALRGARTLRFRGVNLTIPLKEKAVGLVDRLTPEAKKAGAVNTVTFGSRAVIGHDTDGEGFLRAIREEWDFDPRGSRVVVIGAGGAARAIVFALVGAEANEITLVNRTFSRAARLAAEARTRNGARLISIPLGIRTDWKDLLRTRDLLVNATSLGMKGEPTPVPARCLPGGMLVFDLVYNPDRTSLLQAASCRGCRVSNGVSMLVHQGALAFEVWTGQCAPVAVMRRALLRELARRGNHGRMRA